MTFSACDAGVFSKGYRVFNEQPLSVFTVICLIVPMKYFYQFFQGVSLPGAPPPL